VAPFSQIYILLRCRCILDCAGHDPHTSNMVLIISFRSYVIIVCKQTEPPPRSSPCYFFQPSTTVIPLTSSCAWFQPRTMTSSGEQTVGIGGLKRYVHWPHFWCSALSHNETSSSSYQYDEQPRFAFSPESSLQLLPLFPRFCTHVCRALWARPRWHVMMQSETNECLNPPT
jgi:hypothetical protein